MFLFWSVFWRVQWFKKYSWTMTADDNNSFGLNIIKKKRKWILRIQQRIFYSCFKKNAESCPHMQKNHSWIDKRHSKNGHFSFGSVHLDICEHSDRTLLPNKTTGSRLPSRVGVHLMNSGTVLCSESTKDQTQQPWYVLPGNKHQKITCECGQ